MPFTTAVYAAEVSKHQTSLPPGFSSAPTTRPGRHDLARPGRLPRRFGIPNPLGAHATAKGVADNWDTLKGFTRTSRFSTSGPVESDGERAIEWSLSWRQRQVRQAEARAAARYLVRADISLFYPSVYTHSIPWALHGKATAKKQRRPQALLGNQIDFAVRQAQDQQTIGIPIGPDWSQVIAEVLLTAVDNAVARRFPDLVGFRLVDDYEFGCSSEPEAEEVLSVLRAELGEYELSLNTQKTEIVDSPATFFDYGDPPCGHRLSVRHLQASMTTCSISLIALPYWLESIRRGPSFSSP